MADPQAIGDYKVVRKLGIGLMGPVYLGTHQNAYWALRVINEEVVRTTPTVGKLIGEVMHKNLVRYKQLGADTTVGGFLSTDYIEARPITRDGLAGMNAFQRLEFICGILEGLAFLHGKGSVHGCLKASNVLLRRRGKDADGLIIDAGLVYVPSAARAIDLLHNGYAAMAPELIEAYAANDRKIVDKALTTAADVYAAGLLVVEVLSGRRAFTDARSVPDLLERKRKIKVTVTGVNDPHAHIDLNGLNRVVAAAIDPAPSSRPLIKDFLTALRACGAKPKSPIGDLPTKIA